MSETRYTLRTEISSRNADCLASLLNPILNMPGPCTLISYTVLKPRLVSEQMLIAYESLIKKRRGKARRRVESFIDRRKDLEAEVTEFTLQLHASSYHAVKLFSERLAIEYLRGTTNSPLASYFDHTKGAFLLLVPSGDSGLKPIYPHLFTIEEQITQETPFH